MAARAIPSRRCRRRPRPSCSRGLRRCSIPILVPPGRKHATPELALRYSSHAGLSFVGLGWSLPLGVLTRSLERGTPSCAGPDPEAFRLTLASSSNELVRDDEDRFLLELDEAFAEAIPDRAGNRWTVRTREGMTYTFGGSEASRVYAGDDRFHDAQGCALTTAWHVTRLEDPNGNQLELEYEKSGNTPLPAEILYGGNAAAGIPHPFRIRFESEDLAALGRPILRTLATGVDQQLERRIRSVVVEARTTASGSFEELRRYELEYDDSLDTAEFLLAAVEATDLPRRSFSYSTLASDDRRRRLRAGPGSGHPRREPRVRGDPRVDGPERGRSPRPALRQRQRTVARRLRRGGAAPVHGLFVVLRSRATGACRTSRTTTSIGSPRSSTVATST